MNLSNAEDVGAIFAIEAFERLAVLYDLWAAIAGAFGGESVFHMPEAILIEAGVVGAVGGAADELPLADDAGVVAGGFEYVGEGFFGEVEVAELDVVAGVGPAGHNLYTGWCAKRLSVTMVKT
ncbi:unnamed protein product, partial [marine sediment metagenome]